MRHLQKPSAIGMAGPRRFKFTRGGGGTLNYPTGLGRGPAFRGATRGKQTRDTNSALGFFASLAMTRLPIHAYLHAVYFAMPAVFATLPNVSYSSRSRLPRSAALLPIGSEPCSTTLALRSGSATAFTIAALSLAITGSGVPL